jgi:hypothetical protein
MCFFVSELSSVSFSTHLGKCSSNSSTSLQMIDETPNTSIVKWNDQGDGFVVKKAHEFAKFILPQKFKHSNFSSFIRQVCCLALFEPQFFSPSHL